MDTLINLYIILPLITAILLLTIKSIDEKIISLIVLTKSILSIGLWVALLGYFIYLNQPYYETQDIALFTSEHYNFTLSFLFDKVSAVYMGLASLLSYMIVKFSCYYLHKDEGYRRFFVTILIFLFSINLISVSGNFETLFLGWEVLGVSSFLLIGYYRNRYLPVRNALKVFSYYRVADAGLLLTMWISHHVWHENIKFSLFYDQGLMAEQIGHHSVAFITMALLIGLAAAVKSAQMPFSTWLARAMEGPTPSSAIFYGSLAVNIGCFLMLRTYHLWDQVLVFKIFVIVASTFTIFMANTTSKVQSSVKAQIAYASITQIAIIFIEIVLGLHTLALIHLTGNALLRAYQLLISPSIVTYLMREQFFNYSPSNFESKLSNKWRNTILIAGIKEWRIESFTYKLFWKPLKLVGSYMNMVPSRMLWLFSAVIFFILSILLYKNPVISPTTHHILAAIISCIGVMVALQAFVERNDGLKAWQMLILAHFWIVLGVGLNQSFNLADSFFYISGIVISGFWGHFILQYLGKKYDLTLDSFHGLVAVERKLSIWFFLMCITMAGFPLSTTFLGEDLLFTHIEIEQSYLAFLVTFLYVVEGIALVRIYTRLFCGPFKSHEFCYARRLA